MKRFRAMFGLAKKANAQAAALAGAAAPPAGVPPLPPAPALPDPLEEKFLTRKLIIVGTSDSESPFRYILDQGLTVKLVFYHPADNAIYRMENSVKRQIIENNLDIIFKKYHSEFTNKYKELLNNYSSTLEDFNRLFHQFETLQHPLDGKDIESIGFPMHLVRDPENVLTHMYIDTDDIRARFQINGKPVNKHLIQEYVKLKLAVRPSEPPKQTNANNAPAAAEPAPEAVEGVVVNLAAANARNDQAGGKRRKARKNRTKRNRNQKKSRKATRSRRA